MVPETVKTRLKSVDPDRCRAAMFAEEAVREDLLTLYAFHGELARVPEIVSEPMIGAIRYQWWRDAIDEIYNGKPVRAHEIATPLAEMIRRTKLPRFWMDQFIDGRERDLDPTPFADIDDARGYAEATSGRLLLLAVKLCDPRLENEADMLALGRAWGLTGLARAWSYYHGSMLSNLSFDVVCGAAEKELSLVDDKLSSETVPAAAYVSLVSGYLKRMRSLKSPESETVSYSPVRKQLRMIRTALSGKIR